MSEEPHAAVTNHGSDTPSGDDAKANATKGKLTRQHLNETKPAQVPSALGMSLGLSALFFSDLIADHAADDCTADGSSGTATCQDSADGAMARLGGAGNQRTDDSYVGQPTVQAGIALFHAWQ